MIILINNNILLFSLLYYRGDRGLHGPRDRHRHLDGRLCGQGRVKDERAFELLHNIISM